MQIPAERLMTVSLQINFQSWLHIIKSRIYLLENWAKALVNNIFHKFQQQSRLIYTQSYTFFNFLIFVVWKPRLNGKKG